MQEKTVASTAVENHTHKIFPQDLNTNDTLFGGLIMSILDRIALVVAERHSEKTCTTVSVDALHFLSPAHLGEILVCKASINHAWNTSMEVGVKVVVDDFHAKQQRHIVSAYFTFVALDENGKPTSVPKVTPETDLQKRRYKEADQRKKWRIKHAEDRKASREKDA